VAGAVCSTLWNLPSWYEGALREDDRVIMRLRPDTLVTWDYGKGDYDALNAQRSLRTELWPVSATRAVESTARPEPSPAAFLYGPGHVIVYGNPAFVAEFGRTSVGMPAVEALPGLPSMAFDLLDLAYREGRSLAGWVNVGGAQRRLVVAVRRDIETNDVYGLAVHLVVRDRLLRPAGTARWRVGAPDRRQPAARAGSMNEVTGSGVRDDSRHKTGAPPSYRRRTSSRMATAPDTARDGRVSGDCVDGPCPYRTELAGLADGPHGPVAVGGTELKSGAHVANVWVLR
jgi:hypothetical protein